MKKKKLLCSWNWSSTEKRRNNNTKKSNGKTGKLKKQNITKLMKMIENFSLKKCDKGIQDNKLEDRKEMDENNKNMDKNEKVSKKN